MKVGLFGGGRWSRVWLEVLRPELKDGDQIVWITQHHAAEARALVSQKALDQVTVLDSTAGAWSASLDLAILANQTAAHASLSQLCLEHGLAILVEKPLALTYAEAQTLVATAHRQQRPYGVNFEFTRLDMILDFARRLESEIVRSIDFSWADPPTSIRYGELKRADVAVPLAHDQLPHVLSILQTLFPSAPAQKILSVTSGADEMRLTVAHSEWQTNIRLSRAAPTRARLISVNQGEFVLDFTEEFPSLSPRPLTRTWREFLAVVDGRLAPEQWSHRADHHLSNVALCEAAAAFK